jgi:preprotein translocase subunit YajC
MRIQTVQHTMSAIALLQQTGAGGLGTIVGFLPFIAIALVFYFLVIAPANKQRKKTEGMLSSLKKGDQVVTTGGIYGNVQGVEADVIYLKIAENVKIKVARSAIGSIIGSESK